MKFTDCALSIIVPVYNVEEYLKECIDSILEQTFKDFELILVDDGSTDKSSILCDEYAIKDDRIIAVHIKNSGIFQARKEGVKYARGKFITFVDGDDWLENNAFETVMEIIEKCNPDMCAYIYSSDGNNREKNLYEERLYCGEEIRDIIIPDMMFDPTIGKQRLNPSVACKFIKKELYKEVTENITDRISLGEDALVTYAAVCRAKSIYISNLRLYHYRNNNSSCVHTFPIERINEVMAFQKSMKKLFCEMNVYEKLEYQLESYIRIFLSTMIRYWFEIELSAMPYIFPYEIIPKNSRVVIYGAGNVGKSYITELKVKKYAKIVGWADKNYNKIKSYCNENVISPLAIQERIFDVLLIAVWDEAVAVDIKTQLKNIGIPEQKIVWSRPMHI